MVAGNRVKARRSSEGLLVSPGRGRAGKQVIGRGRDLVPQSRTCLLAAAACPQIKAVEPRDSREDLVAEVF